VVGLFQKVCSVITISDDTNRYDSLAEMKHHIGSRIKNFNISGENPKVHFLLNKAEKVPGSSPGQTMTQLFPELRTEEATDAADNLFYAAKELITAHQQTVITPFFFIIGVLVVAGLLSLGIQGIKEGRGLPNAIREVEEYQVDLSNVTVLELVIVPDISRGSDRASLKSLRVA
jgi:hypothetical protein